MTRPVAALVTGSRHWTDRDAVRARLIALPGAIQASGTAVFEQVAAGKITAEQAADLLMDSDRRARAARRPKWMPLFDRRATEATVSIVIHGAAHGADSIAASLARELGLTVEAYPAEAYGAWPACGPRRNAAMVRRLVALRDDDGFEVRVLAFPLPGGKGTLDCMRKARAAKLDVVVCTRVEDIFDSAGRPLQPHARVFEQMARAEGDWAESIALRFMHVLLGKDEG